MEFLSNLDVRVFLFINSSTSYPFMIFLATVLSGVGKFRYLWFAAAFFVVYRLRSKQKIIFILTVVVVISYLISLVVFKPLFGRLRPEYGVPSAVVYNTDTIDHYAFPSIHSTISFAIAYVLAYAYPSLQIYFYIFAFLVALSRIYLGVHYPSDVLVGGILGILVGYGVVKLVTKYSKKSARKR